MDDDPADTDGVSGVRDALDGILEEAPTHASASEAEIDGEPPQHDDRNGVWHVASKLARQPSQADRTRSKSVIADDTVLFTDDEGSACAIGLISASALDEPFVERDLARSELSQVMMFRQHGWRRQRHWLFPGRERLQALLQALVWLRRRIETLDECLEGCRTQLEMNLIE
jgi:hypothetical protein